MRITAFLCLLILVLINQGCLDIENEPAQFAAENDRQLEAFVDSLRNQVQKSPHGFYYEPVTVSGSKEKPQPGDIAGIYYKLSLINGQPIDSLQEGEPLTFKHLRTLLFPQAIDLGIAYMEKGDVYRLYIPSYLAYFDLQVTNKLPAYSNIIAEIRLADLRDSASYVHHELEAINAWAANNGFSSKAGFFYKKIQDGNGNSPETNELIKATYSRSFIDGREIDKGSATFRPDNVPMYLKGIGECIRTMKKGETAQIIVPSHKGFWDKSLLKNKTQASLVKVIPESFAPEILIPAFSTLVYEIKLHEN